MNQFKKVIFAILTGAIGSLLALAGLNLIQVSNILNLYTGVALLILAVLLYLLG